MHNTPRQNIILTGMPGSGKTTIGKKLAKETGMLFCDFDDDILEKISIETAEKVISILKIEDKGILAKDIANKKVGQLLKLLGDDSFLELEGLMGRTLSFLYPTVLSTSGSLPLRKETMDELKKNGKVIYIDIEIDLIISRLKEMKTDRIIGMGKMTLEEILKHRINFYNITKNFDFKVPTFESRIGKTKEERAIEKELVFNKFMEFYKNSI